MSLSSFDFCHNNFGGVRAVLSLADHTNGHAYATMLCPSVVCLYRCIVAKPCIPEQTLLLTALAIGSHT